MPPLDYALVYRVKRENPQLRIVVNGGIASLDDAGAKIKAALFGRSLASRKPVLRPVTVRFSPRYPTPRSGPVRAQAEWRAAA